jgi:hypothetical protein
MLGLINPIVDAADETDEERVERIQQTADEHGIDAMTLLEVEKRVRKLALAIKGEHMESVDGELADMADDAEPDVMQALQPVLGMLGDDAETVLLSKALTKDPEFAATVVRSMDAIYRRQGLYDDLGVSEPAPGAFSDERPAGEK